MLLNCGAPLLQVSAHLAHILRLPFSGPKIAQKYLDQPVLFNRPEIGAVKETNPSLLIFRNSSLETMTVIQTDPVPSSWCPALY